MAGEIDSIDDFVALVRAAAANVYNGMWTHKIDYVEGAAVAAMIAGEFNSLWRFSGFPSAGAAPTSWATCDASTPGGWRQSNPSGSNVKRLVSLALGSRFNGCFLLYDRLGHNGNLSGTDTAAQTFTGSISRYNSNSSCIGNIAFAEVYTIIGSTATTFTISYTSESGSAGSTSGTVAIGGTGKREAHLFLPIRLASGDRGIQAVANADLLATTGTVGAWGITLARPLALVGVSTTIQSKAAMINFVEAGGMPVIKTDACLAVACITGTLVPNYTMLGSFIEGA